MLTDGARSDEVANDQNHSPYFYNILSSRRALLDSNSAGSVISKVCIISFQSCVSDSVITVYLARTIGFSNIHPLTPPFDFAAQQLLLLATALGSSISTDICIRVGSTLGTSSEPPRTHIFASLRPENAVSWRWMKALKGHLPECSGFWPNRPWSSDLYHHCQTS